MRDEKDKGFVPIEIEEYGRLPRGRQDLTVVALREYRNGCPKLDIRIFEPRQKGRVMRMFAKSGVTVDPKDIPDLIRLLRKAQEDATMRGIL